MSAVSKPDIYVANQNPIVFELPKMVYDECFLISDNNTALFSRQRKYRDPCFSTISVDNHFRFFNIFNQQNLHEQIYNPDPVPKGNRNLGLKTFSVLGLLMRSNNWSVGDMSFQAVSDKFIQTISLMHYYSHRSKVSTYLNIHQSKKKTIKIPFGKFGMCLGAQRNTDIVVNDFGSRNDEMTIYRSKVVENLDLDVPGYWAVLEPLVPKDPTNFMNLTIKMKAMLNIYFDNTVAEPIKVECNSQSFKRFYQTIKNNPVGMRAMIGSQFKSKKNTYIGKVGQETSSFVSSNAIKSSKDHWDTGYQILNEGLLKTNYDFKGTSSFQLPDYSRLVTDCTKM
jgi:hypothetical protein